jgi:alkaline phosphatase D
MEINRSLVYKGERPWPNERLGTASIVGHTTDTTTRIWIRTGRLGKFKLLLWEKRGGAQAIPTDWMHRVPLRLSHLPLGLKQSDPLTITHWNDDTTHVFDWGNLAPATEYAYALYWYGYADPASGAKEEPRIYLGHDRPRYFRTMPTADSDDPVCFAFYSCHQPFKLGTLRKRYKLVNDEMWDVFQEALERHSGRKNKWLETEKSKKDKDESLRFVIGGGDQVYADAACAPNIWKLLEKQMGRKGGKLHPDLEEMKNWYRDIYRGYWGFPSQQHIYANFPNYMTWDDHELHDGWGSHEMRFKKVIRSQFLDYRTKSKNMTVDHARTLIKRMIKAGKTVYHEYQHSHNPATPQGQWDYHFAVGSCAVYVLDGRGHRDLERPTYKILGEPQMKRFKAWLKSAAVRKSEFVFVVSAVPVFHLMSLIGSNKFKKFLDIVQADSLIDDLRDHWEDEVHNEERHEFLQALFDAADRGSRICILSGDVHLAAAFKLTRGDSIIYQLTSSAITWNLTRLKGLALKLGVPEKGTSTITRGKGKKKKAIFSYDFERLALYKQSNFAIIKTDPEAKEVTFQLYGDPESKETVNEIDSDYERRLQAENFDLTRSHSMARIPLRFK